MSPGERFRLHGLLAHGPRSIADPADLLVRGDPCVWSLHVGGDGLCVPVPGYREAMKRFPRIAFRRSLQEACGTLT